MLANAEDYFSAEYYFGGTESVVSCSPDRLAETLSAIFGDEVKKYPTFPVIGKWLHSEFRIGETKKSDCSENSNKVKRIIRIANLEKEELEKATDGIAAQIDEIEKNYDKGIVPESEWKAQLDELRARIKKVSLRRKNLEKCVRELIII